MGGRPAVVGLRNFRLGQFYFISGRRSSVAKFFSLSGRLI